MKKTIVKTGDIINTFYGECSNCYTIMKIEYKDKVIFSEKISDSCEYCGYKSVDFYREDTARGNGIKKSLMI